MGWWPEEKELPKYGSVNGEKDVWFKVKDNGETLLSDAKNNPDKFNRYDSDGKAIQDGGQHDHYGSGNGRNNNGTERGYYTGPGSRSNKSSNSRN